LLNIFKIRVSTRITDALILLRYHGLQVLRELTNYKLKKRRDIRKSNDLNSTKKVVVINKHMGPPMPWKNLNPILGKYNQSANITIAGRFTYTEEYTRALKV